MVWQKFLVCTSHAVTAINTSCQRSWEQTESWRKWEFGASFSENANIVQVPIILLLLWHTELPGDKHNNQIINKQWYNYLLQTANTEKCFISWKVFAAQSFPHFAEVLSKYVEWTAKIPTIES